MQISYGNFSIPLKVFENYMAGMMCGHLLRAIQRGHLNWNLL